MAESKDNRITIILNPRDRANMKIVSAGLDAPEITSQTLIRIALRVAAEQVTEGLVVKSPRKKAS